MSSSDTKTYRENVSISASLIRCTVPGSTPNRLAILRRERPGEGAGGLRCGDRASAAYPPHHSAANTGAGAVARVLALSIRRPNTGSPRKEYLSPGRSPDTTGRRGFPFVPAYSHTPPLWHIDAVGGRPPHHQSIWSKAAEVSSSTQSTANGQNCPDSPLEFRPTGRKLIHFNFPKVEFPVCTT